MNIEIASLGRALLFLGVPFVFLVAYLQYKWAKVCRDNIRVLVVQSSGGGRWDLAPKQGGEVTIINPETNDARTWPVNELATIDVLYPGVGFLPEWMQKTIRLAIVNEGDWEPMLNRSPHRRKIASPDVMAYLKSLAEQADDKLRAEIELYVGELSTGPTREMIADPAILGNLMRSQVLKTLATVSNDLMESLKQIKTQLARLGGLNGMVIYILLGVILVVNCVLLWKVLQGGGGTDVSTSLQQIKDALGIKP